MCHWGYGISFSVPRGFLHFSQQVRYRIALASIRWDARALDVMVGGARLEDRLDREFVVAIPSFLRMLARSWEHTVVNGPGRSLFALRALPFTDRSLFMRPEIQAHIDAHGGVTAQAAARPDGRLQLWPSSSPFPSLTTRRLVTWGPSCRTRNGTSRVAF